MHESYKIYQTVGGKSLWELPCMTMEQYSLKQNQNVTLKCGSLSTRVKIRASKMSNCAGKYMGLSNDLLKTLKLPEGLSLKIRQVETGDFCIGPIIGILTFDHVVAKKAFRRYIPYAKRMKNTGLFYVFGPSDIKSEKTTVTGYYYIPRKKIWQTAEFPLPDAVIDRTYPNDGNTHLKLEKVIGKNRIFNKKTLITKIDFYKVLEKDSFLRNHIPETRILTQPSDLTYFLNKYDEVFLKPSDGMKGRGIVLVSSTGSKLLCRYMAEQTPVSEEISGPGHIFAILGCLNRYKRPYVVQEAIQRMKCDNKPFNFRVMVAKDGSGLWSVPAVFAKLALPDGFLTNNSAGAQFVLLKDLFPCIKEQLPLAQNDFLDLLTDLSIQTSKALDRELGPLGKLGIDIIVDESGKPWLIEANGNPGIMPLNSLTEYPSWCSRMYDLPLAYAMFLAGFNSLDAIKTCL